MEYIGCPKSEGETPCGDEFLTNAGFPWEYIILVHWFQWVHTLFRRARLLCQEKCLVVNKHQTRACKCWLPPERCLQRGCFGRSPLVCWWKAGAEDAQQFCKSVWVFIDFYSPECPPLCHKYRKCADAWPSFKLIKLGHEMSVTDWSLLVHFLTMMESNWW